MLLAILVEYPSFQNVGFVIGHAVSTSLGASTIHARLQMLLMHWKLRGCISRASDSYLKQIRKRFCGGTAVRTADFLNAFPYSSLPMLFNTVQGLQKLLAKHARLSHLPSLWNIQQVTH